MQSQLEVEPTVPCYISECNNCDFATTTMEDVYRFCPLCGKPLTTWEDIGGGVKGREV